MGSTGEQSWHRHLWIAFSAETAAAWEYHNLTLFLRIRWIKKSCSAPIHNDDYIVEWKQLPKSDLNWYVVIYVTKCLVISLRTNSSFRKRTIKSFLMLFFLHVILLLIQFFQKLFINYICLWHFRYSNRRFYVISCSFFYIFNLIQFFISNV